MLTYLPSDKKSKHDFYIFGYKIEKNELNEYENESIKEFIECLQET